MEILKATSNVTRIHLVNARDSRSFMEWKEAEPVIAAAVVQDNDTVYSYVWTETATYAGNSATIRDVMDDVIDIINEGEVVSALVNVRQSKSGKDFATLRLL